MPPETTTGPKWSSAGTHSIALVVTSNDLLPACSAWPTGCGHLHVPVTLHVHAVHHTITTILSRAAHTSAATVTPARPWPPVYPATVVTAQLDGADKAPDAPSPAPESPSANLPADQSPPGPGGPRKSPNTPAKRSSASIATPPLSGGGSTLSPFVLCQLRPLVTHAHPNRIRHCGDDPPCDVPPAYTVSTLVILVRSLMM